MVPLTYGTCDGTGVKTCVNGQYGICSVTSADPRLANCSGKTCGSDDCDGVCGTCAVGTETCNSSYQCVANTCASFTYSDWSPSTCPASGQQTRTVTSSSPTGCAGGSPITSHPCIYTCTPETDTAFCTRLGKNCGTVSGTDIICGTPKTVNSCGTCSGCAEYGISPDDGSTICVRDKVCGTNNICQ